MTRTNAPSLIGGANEPAPSAAPKTLLDLMYDGFYALFMLKNDNGPQDNADFVQKMSQFLDEFGSGAKKQNASADDIDAAKYAFCAAVDEIILRSTFSIREQWARRPLQLTLFGDQLAGENFFNRLESLRARGSAHLHALEVFHMCLLLGFEGKYIIEGSEKLKYLTARLGDEIASMKGKRGGFAPHAERPDAVTHKLRTDVSLWVLFSVFTLICLVGFAGLRMSLNKTTEEKMTPDKDLVQLAPKQANLTITLP